MFSRKILSLLKTSIKNPLSNKTSIPLKSINKHKVLINAIPQYNFTERGGYLEHETSYQFAKDSIKNYLELEKPGPKEIFHMLNELERYKMGIVTSDSFFQGFFNKFAQQLDLKFTPKQIVDLVQKGYDIGIKNINYWNKILSIVKSNQRDIDVPYLITIFYTFIKLRMTREPEMYVSSLALKLKDFLQDILKHLKLKNVIEVCYIYSQLDIDFPEATNTLKSLLMKEIVYLELNIPANELAVCAYLIFKHLDEKDHEKPRLIKELITTFIQRDLLEYDTSLQHYEYDNPRPGNEGIKEKLNYQSLAMLYQIVMTEKYYDDTSNLRLTEAVFRLSETGVIDFDSAAWILKSLSYLVEKKDFSLIMRIIEMVEWQMSNEPAEMHPQLNWNNVTAFLSGLNRLKDRDLDIGYASDVFRYIAGCVLLDKINGKAEDHVYKKLAEIFKHNKELLLDEESVIEFLEKKIDVKTIDGKN